MNRTNALKTNKFIDILKRILDNDVFTEKKISTLSDDDHDLLNWTTCFDDNCNTHRWNKKENEWYFKKFKQYEYNIDECEHDTWRTCQNWQCEEHIIEKIEYRKIKFHHKVLDWNFCENKHCSYHIYFRNVINLKKLKHRYFWLKQIQAKKIKFFDRKHIKRKMQHDCSQAIKFNWHSIYISNVD